MKNSETVIKNVLLKLYKKLVNKEFRNNTVEELNVHLTFNPEEEYLDYYDIKPASRNYIENELNWYLSRDLSIKGHKGIENNPVWKSCATDEEGKINSNYGYIVYEPIKYKRKTYKNQLDFAVEKLKQDKCTLQAIIIYTRPDLHITCCDNKHAKHDFTCTTHTQIFITNDNKLEYIVNMRSNDSIFGLQNDYSWHRYVYYDLYNKLKETYPKLKIGHIYWNAGSMHLYDRHYDLLEKIIKEYKNENKSK